MGWDDRPPRRHLGFSSAGDLHQILTRSSPPHSCFHSTAYYDRPSEWKMADKGWRGADLIFDLDGDHLPGVDALNFPAMLTTIQEQAFRLWNDFLEPDFGFKEEHATFSFSATVASISIIVIEYFASWLRHVRRLSRISLVLISTLRWPLLAHE